MHIILQEIFWNVIICITRWFEEVSTEKQIYHFSGVHECKNWKTTSCLNPFSFIWPKFRFILSNLICKNIQIYWSPDERFFWEKKPKKQKSPTSTSRHESRQNLWVSDQRKHEIESKLFGTNKKLWGTCCFSFTSVNTLSTFPLVG